jgi:serine/threonine-protein kinase
MTESSLAERMVGVSDLVADKYRIEGVLGTGGMGVVFAATHLDLDRLVAVKVMRSEMLEHPDAVERLLLEAKLAGRFRSEHVCKVLDVGTMPDGVPFIVMEYLEGDDFATLLAKSGAFDIKAAIDFMLEACEALAEAHAANIIHRDLKPENLFAAANLDGSVSLKILDFGVSKQVGALSGGRSLTNPSATLGSPFYMAPEQMRSAKDVDTRTDLWAIGAILFELLTDRRVFEGESVPEVCAAVLSGQPKRVTELRPDVPEVLADAIDRCLQKDVNDRFPTVGDLAQAIAPFGSESAVASLARVRRLVANPALVEVRAKTLPASVRVASRPGARAVTRDSRMRRIATKSEFPSHRRARTLPWLAALLASATALVGAGVLHRTRTQEPRASAPVKTSYRAEPRPPAKLVPTTATATKPPLESPKVSSPVALPDEPEATVFAKHERAPVARTTRPRAKAPAAVAPPPSTEASTPASSPKSNATEAWNPESFGPRR